MATSKQFQQQAKMNDKKISRLQRELKEALAKKKTITASLVKVKAEEKKSALLKKAKAATKSKAKTKKKTKGSAKRKK